MAALWSRIASRIAGRMGLAAGLALGSLAQAQPTSGPLPAHQRVAGASQVEWSQRWWQWAFSFERARSPVADVTGQYCGSRQAGAVWFLAGTYGTRRTERHCVVPAGKHLFFPVINHVTFRPEGAQTSCKALMADAAATTDAPSVLALEVDGVRYAAPRIARLVSPTCFSLVPGGPADAAANGYFVMLPPLPPGPHLIEFAGALPGMQQGVTYQLTVAPR